MINVRRANTMPHIWPDENGKRASYVRCADRKTEWNVSDENLYAHNVDAPTYEA